VSKCGCCCCCCHCGVSICQVVACFLTVPVLVIITDFWGPLYVGCAASHFFTDLVKLVDARFGYGGGLATYPCVVILCTMGAAHVGTFLLLYSCLCPLCSHAGLTLASPSNYCFSHISSAHGDHAYFDADNQCFRSRGQ